MHPYVTNAFFLLQGRRALTATESAPRGAGIGILLEQKGAGAEAIAETDAEEEEKEARKIVHVDELLRIYFFFSHPSSSLSFTSSLTSSYLLNFVCFET